MIIRLEAVLEREASAKEMEFEALKILDGLLAGLGLLWDLPVGILSPLSLEQPLLIKQKLCSALIASVS